MALRIKGHGGHALDQLQYDMFWTEFRAIEESRSPVTEEDHDEESSKEPPGECEQEIQWLKEAGFDAIVKKYNDSKEIDPNDVNFEKITGSLTRKQAEAVRKRIDTLNQSTKKKLGLHVAPSKHSVSSYPTDVRTIFPVKTNGQPSNAAEQIHTARPALRKSYSEGVHVIKQSSLEIGGTENEVGRSCRHSRSTGILSSPADKEFTGVYLHPDCALERRTSDEMQLRTGIQQHPHGGSVFYITGTTKQELFNTAEKTKESIVDDVNNCNLKSLNLSPPDTSPDSFHEVPVDCPEEVPVDVPSDKIHGKVNGQIVSDAKPFREPQFPRLPNFTLTKDELGVTRVQDISSQDMEKVRSLSLIELTALFDSHGLALHRRKPVKRRVRESGIFGVPLQNLIQEDKMRNEKTSVPSFYVELVRYLEFKGLKEEGILRVPGNAGRVKAIREEVEEKFNDGCFVWDIRRPHDCATLLKQFLRELPFPLLTQEYQPTFASVESIPDRKQQLQALNLLILLLPAVHRDCLKILVQFLSQVVAHEKQNKMGLNSVAMIMAPNLFLCTSKSQPALQEIKQAQGTVNIVRMLIKYQAILWTIPGFMVMQVRYLYEAEGNKKAKDAKAVRKLLAKRGRGDGVGGSPQKKHSIGEAPLVSMDSDYENNIIRVRAPMLNKVLMAIQLTEFMCAGDIVSKFRRRSSPSEGSCSDNQSKLSESSPSASYRNCLNPHNNNKFASDNFFLYEAGGNIGERCLDHDTNMMALRKVNPHADWIVKPQTQYLHF